MPQKCLYEYYENDFTDIVTKLAKQPDTELEEAAARVGTIILAMGVLNKNNPEKWHIPDESDNFNWTDLELAEDEVQGAERYAAIYRETQDDLFAQLRNQESSHASHLLDRATAKATSPADKKEIEALRGRLRKLEM